MTKHGHGATPTGTMAHVAMDEALNGGTTIWPKHVAEEQYQQGPQV